MYVVHATHMRDFPCCRVTCLVSLCISDLVVELPCISKEESFTDLIFLNLKRLPFFFERERERESVCHLSLVANSTHSLLQ